MRTKTLTGIFHRTLRSAARSEKQKGTNTARKERNTFTLESASNHFLTKQASNSRTSSQYSYVDT